MLDQWLKSQEGLRLKTYPDPETGKPTIGWGRCLSDDPLNNAEMTRLGLTPGFDIWNLQITEDEAQYLFDNVVGYVRSEVQKRLPWIANLDTVRADVLYDMAYNMGVGGLMGFHNTLNFVKTGDYENAANGILHSKADKELPERYGELAEVMRTGVDRIL